MPRAGMGRYAEPALWILVALGRGPARSVALLDAVRRLDGPVGPGTLMGALARLESRAVIERAMDDGRPMYRLTSHSREEAA